jgi:hypothetical protein
MHFKVPAGQGILMVLEKLKENETVGMSDYQHERVSLAISPPLTFFRGD